MKLPLPLLALTTAVAFSQGPLAPDSAPEPSMKTLTEIEPRIAINAANTPGDADSLFKITQPGSYYLAGNITGVAGKHGIEIAASGVTLDLNGFDLVGVPGMGAFDGVAAVSSTWISIAVVNGSVRNWGNEGVSLNGQNNRVDGVRARGNTGYGIYTGAGSTVSNCAAFDNAANGINTASGCMVTNCTAYDNVVNEIYTYAGGTVSNCTVRQNTLDGIACDTSCVIRDNACSSNGSSTGNGAGVRATGNNNRIEGNNCVDGDLGIVLLGAGNIMLRNTCSDNTINYDIFAGNRYGQIVNITAVNPTAVSGNSAASTLGSTDPWANFAY